MEIAINLHGDDDACKHPTIKDLVVGPGPEQAGQILAAYELLKANGHDRDVVRKSDVAFRG